MRSGKDGKPVIKDGITQYTKVPYTINGKRAAANNPETWNTFQDVVKTFHKSPGTYTGIGIVISKDTGLVGIDFDHVRNPETGEWNKTAWEEINELNSYTELSPSGSGCHVFVYGEMLESGKRKAQPDGTDREMYQDLHFFTVTGNKVDELPDNINEPHVTITNFYDKWFTSGKQKIHREREERNQEDQIDQEGPGPQVPGEQEGRNKKLSDSEIIEIACRAGNSEKFNRLYKGDIEGYPSQSEADLAFCSMLAFYTQEREQIERIFRNSGLYRKEKGNDYRKRTIDTAIKGQKETYNPDKKLGRAKAKSKHRKREEEEYEKEERVDPVSQYPENIQNFAYKLLREGDPFAFMLETWSLRHVGDRNIGENCLCAAASTYVLNSNGIHNKPSGESGKGKSDGMETALLLLPSRKYISGSLSAKNLFYDDSLSDGLIVYSDDVHLNDDMISTVKQSTSNFQVPKLHRTLIKQEAVSKFLPARISWWFSSVDGFSDEQLANRFVNCDVDGSREQDLRVLNHIKDTEELDLLPDDDDLLICRCIFDILDRETYIIKIPYIKAIDWRNPENRRNFKKFLDIIRSVTLFKIFQRERVKGYYLAEYEDFERAREIYKGTAKHNATNLTDRELKVLQFIVGKNKYDGNKDLIIEAEVETHQIMNKFDLSQSRVHQILHGKDGKGGMLAKIPNLSKVEKSVSTGDEEKTTRKKNAYVYRGKNLGFEIYDSVATLEKEAATQATEQFIKTITRDTIASITPLLPNYYPNEVIVKSSIEDRIDNNITSNKSNNTPSIISVYNQLDKQSIHQKGSYYIEGNRVTANEKKPTDNDLTITNWGNSKVIEGNRCNKCEENNSNGTITPTISTSISNGNNEKNNNSGTITHTITPITSTGNNEVIDDIAPIKGNNEKLNFLNNDTELFKKLKFLKQEIKTYQTTWIRKNGSIGDPIAFCDKFLRSNPGFLQTFSHDMILSEVEKICNKIPREMQKVSAEDTGEKGG